MFKYVIEYQDHEGEDRKRTLYFNLDKDELLRIQMRGAKITEEDEVTNGMSERINEIIKSRDADRIFDLLEWVIKEAYGERDGELMVKDEDAWKRFRYSRAYSEFLFKLFSDSELAASFISETFPKGVVEEFNKTDDGRELLDRMKDRSNQINQ